MALFDFLKGNGDSQGKKLLDFSLEPLDVAMAMASSQLDEKVKEWDLGNPYLMATLGYVFGWIDSAYQATHPKKYNEKLVESIFDRQIEKYFEVEVLRPDLSRVGGMQGDLMFDAGTRAGGNDFIALINEKRPPFSLYKLLESGAG